MPLGALTHPRGLSPVLEAVPVRVKAAPEAVRAALRQVRGEAGAVDPEDGKPRRLKEAATHDGRAGEAESFRFPAVTHRCAVVTLRKTSART